MRTFDHELDRPKTMIRERLSVPPGLTIRPTNMLQVWAAAHAHSLCLLAIMNVVTWILILVNIFYK